MIITRSTRSGIRSGIRSAIRSAIRSGIRSRVRSFVIHMMIAPDEYYPMTADDAATSMRMWKAEGLSWPKGMTADMLAEIWNTEII